MLVHIQIMIPSAVHAAAGSRYRRCRRGQTSGAAETAAPAAAAVAAEQSRALALAHGSQWMTSTSSGHHWKVAVPSRNMKDLGIRHCASAEGWQRR